MRKKRNIVLIILVALVLVLGVGYVTYRFLQDENAFTVTEKKYIVDNKSKVISINVLNDANVFGRDGKGVFYDFLKSFSDDNDLTFNIVTSSIGDEVSGLSLSKGSTLPEDAKLLYTDHYVLVGKEYASIANIGDVSKNIGYLNKDESLVNGILKNASLTLKNYESKNELLEGLKNDEVSYMIVPMLEYLDVILENLYTIDYHFSDLKDYYYMTNSSNEVLSSILSKYYNKWSVENFTKSFNDTEYEMFTSKLKITEKELDVIDSKKYKYGFIENGPYDTKMSGVYGGIISKYISAFSEFSGISFDYTEYSSYDRFTKAVSKGDVDLFLNYYSISTSMATVETSYTVDISFVMKNSDDRVYSSISALNNEKIYAKENSIIYSYLVSLGLNVDTYKNEKELKKIFKSDGIVAMDYANYLIYKDNNADVTERFRVNTSSALEFQSNNDTMFNRLFSYYISTIDKNQILYTGIADYNRTITSGSIIYKITKYAIIIIIVITLVVYVTYRLGKKAFKKKKIKRSDKMKYIDILTSLKNRNYLNESTPIWNQNTIYPQAVVVIDLNSIQELNDTYGYKEGDKQIQAAANALIKTQLDNSEIMRTDGNEFTVYLVGYNEKQIISYIKKLNKEFKNLPHDKGAAVGFSMIEDDLKLISDAINEATEKMRENKSLAIGEDNDEKI